jgi:nitrogenase-stabilizing/protective protein
LSEIKNALGNLSSAEEFLNYLEVEFDQHVVNVNRLHILKRFNQYMALHKFKGGGEVESRAEYKALLQRAYGDFVSSDAATQKVFKVFQDATGVKTFSVDSLRASLPPRRSA